MEFVTFELAKKLKEKGFKEECLSYYTTEYTLYNNVITLTDDKYLCVSDIDYEEFLVSHNSIKYTNGNYVDAPTIEQVLEWLRKEKNLYIAIRTWGGTWGYDVIGLIDGQGLHWVAYHEDIKSYEDAALAGIEYAIDNLI